MSLKSTNPSHNEPSSNPALSRLNASFLQGLLTHLPATYIFTLPTPASYVRAVDGVWSGGTYVAWGRDNRETPVRLCGIGADDPNLNFEVKCVDATANPYLAVAALLSAGLDGVRKGMELTVGKCQVPASLMTVEERKSKGVDVRLPLNVEEARAALLADEVIRKAMGEELVEKFLATNKVSRTQVLTNEKV
jgi:glutamine synthetase